MIELFRLFPVVHVMAACTVVAELSLVDVLVATHTIRGQAKVGLG